MSRSYEVGYRKPPKDTRFKKGQSGNPKGRPRGRTDIAAILEKVLQEAVMIKQNGQVRHVRLIEAYTRQFILKSMDGSPREMAELLKFLKDYAPNLLVASDLPSSIQIRFIESDGHGRPADKALWKELGLEPLTEPIEGKTDDEAPKE
ncbi:hypothetical protein D3874_17760 [Oleomonas cavernae]|uniref:DUF5681 domain-containing protein n=1 Tax=Oleomonas cavernae TaxID=2320859 RepID=A0A418WF31_9PROT|nr:DUF5681 domain-containing protein [Oleomonas cavernae]RJF88614.1 hypothetical protein D3874_17760 [Oleomonas cavernae]